MAGDTSPRVACLRAPRDFEIVDAMPPPGLSVQFFSPRSGEAEFPLADVPSDVEAVVLASVGPRLDTHEFRRFPRLRLVQFTGVGIDRVDRDALTNRGVTVRGCPAVNADDVAEYTVAAATMLLRRIPVADRHIKAGDYVAARGPFVQGPVRSLRGLTWGIVGFGAIGRAVGRLAAAHRCSVVYHDVAGADEIGYESRAVELDDLLRAAEVVSIHLPLTGDTRGLLSRERVALLRPDAVLINVARGGIVDEAAVRERLVAGTLWGAAFDVYEREPPPAGSGIVNPSALPDAGHLLLTPHIAGVTHQAWHDLFAHTWRSVEEALMTTAGITGAGAGSNGA